MGNEELQRAMGERISKRRKQLGFTQEQLAAGMDVSTQMISYVEQGRKAIRPENLIKLCSVLDISADYILTGQLGAKEHMGIAAKLSTLSEEELSLVENILDNCIALAKKQH